MKITPTITEIVMGTFAFYDSNEDIDTFAFYDSNEDIEFDILRVYDGFYELSKKFPELFEELYFSDKGGQMYSKKLEEVLFSLGTGGIIEIIGPIDVRYNISKNSRARTRNYLKDNLKKELIDKISEASKEVYKFARTKR